MNGANEMKLEFDSRSCNESFARVTVAAFMAQMNPTLDEVADVKTALSEAVTNSVVHGYEGEVKKISVECRIDGDEIHIIVIDKGCGIENVEQAMEPLFTTKPELERSGMGFSFMEAFMDDVRVESSPGNGTRVYMKKKVGCADEKTDR